jgi:hypothetical protein
MDSVRPFFDAYAKAFEAYDAAAVAGFFALPCLFVRGGESETVDDAPALVESVEQLLDLHRAWKVQTARLAAFATLEDTPQHRIVRVTWRLGRTLSRVRWTYATTYVLVPDDGGPRPWRIVSAISHDAPF